MQIGMRGDIKVHIKTNEIEEKVLEVVSRIQNSENEGINNKICSANGDLGLNSLSAIELVVNLEQEFNITFLDEDLLFDNFNTIDKIIEMVQSKMSMN